MPTIRDTLTRILNDAAILPPSSMLGTLNWVADKMNAEFGPEDVAVNLKDLADLLRGVENSPLTYLVHKPAYSRIINQIADAYKKGSKAEKVEGTEG
jgi:hypothetical protein